MDGVLEATITLCGCKVLCSILCLPAFKDSLSSVSLCCSCLLLFTDLSITVFLAYLWCAAPRPVPFHPSSDTIALHFMLFLSNTYGAVLILTPVLVAVEVLLRLLWRQEVTMSKSTIGKKVEVNKHSELSPVVLLMDAGEEAWEMEPLQKGKEKEDIGVLFKFLKAVGFLGCLLLWCMSGTYAGSSWRQDQPMVRECLDKGGSLSACLPCLLTASSPIGGQFFWSLAAVFVVLGLIEGLGLLLSKLAQLPVLVFQTNQLQISREIGSASGFHLRTFWKWLKDHESSKNRMQRGNFVALWLTKAFERATEHNDTADLKKTADSCTAQSVQLEYNESRWAPGNPVPLSGQTGLAEGCKLHSKGVLLVSLQPSELPLTGTKAAEGTGLAPHPHEMRLWKPPRESPYLRGDLMTGLVCGLLVWVFPTVLSTNILLVSNLDTLAVYVVKHLLIATHSK